MTFPLMPLRPVNPSPPVVTFITSMVTSTNYTTVTWPAVSLGTPSSGRYIVISVHTDNAGIGPISASIGGVAATVLQATEFVGIFMALVPAGTTGDIVITFSGLTGRHAVGVWSVTGLSRSSPKTAAASGTSLAASCSITVEHGAAIIAAVVHNGGTGVTWSGGGVSERFDLAAGTNGRFSSADANNLAAATYTITATGAASAAWRIAAISLR